MEERPWDGPWNLGQLVKRGLLRRHESLEEGSSAWPSSPLEMRGRSRGSRSGVEGWEEREESRVGWSFKYELGRVGHRHRTQGPFHSRP